MEIKFLGTGGAFNVEQGNSSALVTVSGKNILIDCGHSVFPALVKKGLADQVDAVVLTHLHDDHAGSISSLLLYHQIMLKKGRLPIVVPTDEFKKTVHDYLAFSLGNPLDRTVFHNLADYPEIGAINTDGSHVDYMQTWAYYFTDGQASICFSGDTGQPKRIFDVLEGLQLPNLKVFHEVGFFDVPAHTNYKALMPYLSDYEIYGYHCDPAHNVPDNKVPLVIDQPDFLA